MTQHFFRRFALCAILITIPTWARAADSTQPVQQQTDGIIVPVNNGTLRLQVWSDRVIRVQYAPGSSLPDHKSFAVIATPAPVKWTYQQTPTAETISTPLISAQVNRKTGIVRFTNAGGQPILTESAPGTFAGAAEQQFQLSGHIYGLGQHQLGLMAYNGSTVHLQQANTDVAVPMLISSNGYGLLWDNPSITDVAVGIPTALDKLTLTSQVADCIDYYFIAGPSLDDVIAAYRDFTGPAPMMGRWAWGLWQCKERYKSQQELLDVAARYRQMDVPIDGIIQDWHYWRNNQWGSHEFDPARYPDPPVLLKQLHDEHFHALISVWPKFELGTQNEQALEKIGGLFEPKFTNGYFKDWSRWYDAFNPAARQLYWQQIDQHLARQGWDGWWLDASEPELGATWHDMEHLTTAAGPGAAVYNAYPLLHTTAVYQGQRKDEPDKRVFILTRSAYAGQQRNAAVTWSGDIQGTWDVLRRQIPAGLNFSASGIPYWNTDIGGFFGHNPKDPAYAELFTRWYQFGAFCPMFRVHGTNYPKEIWQFDDSTQKILLATDQLRYRLLPYIYSVSWRVTHNGYTMMRPLVMDFRTDPLALDIPDQFMFGPSIMVCPIVHPQATGRYVYLPPAPSWFNFWTGQAHGSGDYDFESPNTLPLFVPAGSIIPMGPIVQYADEKPNAPLEIRIYPGRDATFELYDDQGDTYNYEKGQYATIPLQWNDAANTLTIGQRVGSYPGMPEHRQFHVVRVIDNRGVGLDERPTPDKPIDYDGKEITVQPTK